MISFNWNRRKISPAEYEKQIGIPSSNAAKTEFTVTVNKGSNDCYTVKVEQDFLDALHGSKHLSAYTVASDIRKFEIDKYWQRTLYFWGFITAIYMAYFNALKEFYCNECTGERFHGSLPLVILSALGLFFCVSWLLASKGSKHWQENWENHLDLLEDDITGPFTRPTVRMPLFPFLP
ncbi:MAG: hypothetical protein IJL80_04215 [Treponema sp.]|nr:hypothetical protein [Treponema sp.]